MPLPRRALLAGCLAACGAPPSPRWATWQDGGERIAFPAEPEVRRVAEGPWARATVAQAQQGDHVFELARFALTERVSPAKRQALLEEILRGLTARPGVLDAQRDDAQVAGKRAIALTVMMNSGRVIHYRVFRRDEDTVLELSVGGPPEGLAPLAERFFASYRAP